MSEDFTAEAPRSIEELSDLDQKFVQIIADHESHVVQTLREAQLNLFRHIYSMGFSDGLDAGVSGVTKND